MILHQLQDLIDSLEDVSQEAVEDQGILIDLRSKGRLLKGQCMEATGHANMKDIIEVSTLSI